MTAKKHGGQPGNRNGARDKPWGEALRKALAQYEDKQAKVNRGEALHKIANKTIKLALSGDQQAIKEIGDRMDGKAKITMDLEAKVHVTPAVNLILDGMVKAVK